jgi:hypothetical protein
MEPDRYKNNHILYIFGIICLILSLTLFFFSLFIAPFLIWHLNYNVPDLIDALITIFEEDYEYSTVVSKALVWLIFFIPSLITGFLAYYISNRIDNQIFKVETQVEEEEKKIDSLEVKRQLKESAGIGFKIILLMIVIVGIILMLELFIQSTT